VAAVCHASPAVANGVLLTAEDHYAADAHDAHASVATWVALACTRGALAATNTIARAGLLMVAGNSWAEGAERAAMEALKHDPGNTTASELLATLALDDQDPDNLPAIWSAIAAARAHGAASRALLRACSTFALERNEPVAGRDCANTALARGEDSTWHLVNLARWSFRGADTVSGTRFFLAAVGAARDSTARAEIDWHLQWFLTPAEQQRLGRVADAARADWVRDRLAERDVRDGQPREARLAEHFNRLEYVLKNFRLHVARNRREALRTMPVADDSATFGNDTLVRAACDPAAVRATPMRFYKRWQTDIDDRGVVWMRFGPPTQRVPGVHVCVPLDTGLKAPPTPSTNTREVWVYKLDGERLILSFEVEALSGSTEATRLVTGVLGRYFCGIDPRRCTLSEQSYAAYIAIVAAGAKLVDPTISSSFVKPDDVQHLHDDDAANIAIATTTDDNSPRGDANIGIGANLHRLWDPLSGDPLALVTWAVPAKDLAIQTSGGERTTLVDFELRQWDPRENHWQDTTFSRHFTVPDTSVKHPNLVGFVAVPSTPGVADWSLVATQPDHRRGRAYDDATGGLATGALALSDLVLGAESQHIVWSLHNVAIPLAPTNTLDRHEPASLYYQVRSDSARDDLQATVALYRVKDGVVADSAALQVSFAQPLREGINEIAPSLDLSRLDTGSYQLEVRLGDARGKVLVRRAVGLTLY